MQSQSRAHFDPGWWSALHSRRVFSTWRLILQHETALLRGLEQARGQPNSPQVVAGVLGQQFALFPQSYGPYVNDEIYGL